VEEISEKSIKYCPVS